MSAMLMATDFSTPVHSTSDRSEVVLEAGQRWK